MGFTIARAVGETYVANVVARTTALTGVIGATFGSLAFLYATMWLFLLGAELYGSRRSEMATGER